jgi:cytochrome P450
LRQGSRRDVPAIIRRHARQTLGKQSLILQSGGSDWKKQRGLVQYALTADAIMEHNSIIMEVANATVRALKILCKKAPQNDCKSVEVNVVNIAQCFTLEVFGKVALAHDFHCFDDSGANRMREAEAFAFLLNDIPLRVNSWNPFLHTYWLPTPYNKTYEVERGICENFLCNVIKQSKDVLATKDCSTSNGKRHHENMLTHIIRRSEDATENLVDMMKTILFAGYVCLI